MWYDVKHVLESTRVAATVTNIFTSILFYNWYFKWSFYYGNKFFYLEILNNFGR